MYTVPTHLTAVFWRWDLGFETC